MNKEKYEVRYKNIERQNSLAVEPDPGSHFWGEVGNAFEIWGVEGNTLICLNASIAFDSWEAWMSIDLQHTARSCTVKTYAAPSASSSTVEQL